LRRIHAQRVARYPLPHLALVVAPLLAQRVVRHVHSSFYSQRVVIAHRQQQQQQQQVTSTEHDITHAFTRRIAAY
jgi:hypothetical protein